MKQIYGSRHRTSGWRQDLLKRELRSELRRIVSQLLGAKQTCLIPKRDRGEQTPYHVTIDSIGFTLSIELSFPSHDFDQEVRV